MADPTVKDISTDPPTQTERWQQAMGQAWIAGMQAAQGLDVRAIGSVRGPHGERVQIVKGQAAIRTQGGTGYGT